MNPLLEEMHRLMPELSRGTSVVYFLQLRSGVIYIGASDTFALSKPSTSAMPSSRFLRKHSPHDSARFIPAV